MPNVYNAVKDIDVGFKKEEETIIDQLIHGPKRREVVLITGMGGLGKTTLARRVYNEKKVINHFDNRAWCTISQEYDCKDLLNKIYSQVCGSETEIDNVAEKLRKSLMGKRYLIVLDDIWSLKAWEELNRVFPTCDNGSRIVLTSRQENVVSDAKCICLPFFTIDESWDLLQVMLFKGKRCPVGLENIGREISKKCGGLPLVVALVVGLLERVEKSEQTWHEFHNTLNSHTAFRDGIQSNDAIELSYKNLPHHLKPCLLYFAAFPEDKVIVGLHLTELWISEGFIEVIEEERIEDKAEDYLNHLAGYNLIVVCERKYDGRVFSCVVHDLVRDFCLTKAKEENFLQIIKFDDKLDSTWNVTPQRICFHKYGDHGIPYKLVPRNSSIHTLLGFEISKRSRGVPNIYNGSWVAKNFEHLTILDFEFITVDKSILSKVNSLIHLRYLALNLRGRGSISPLSLGNLECLITLKLRSRPSNLHLPKFFWNMRSLRHMIIFHYCDLCMKESTSVTEAISCSEVLQTLDFSFPLSTRDEHLLRKFLHLKILSCRVSPSYPFLEIDFLRHLEFLKLFGIEGYPSLLNDLKPSKFPSSIRDITLCNITLSSFAISIIAQLSNLEVLRLLAYCNFEDSIWNVEEETQFRKLKHLEIHSLDLLIWNATADSLPCLEQLILVDCMFLEEVPSSLADILTLKVIIVDNCNPDVNRSAKKIQEDAEDIGNEQLNVVIKDVRERLSKWQNIF